MVDWSCMCKPSRASSRHACQQFYRRLRAAQWFDAAIGAREQERAFDLAEDGGCGNRRVVGLRAKARKPARDFLLPALERAARCRSQHVRLRGGFQRRRRDRAAIAKIGLLEIGSNRTRDAGQKRLGIGRGLRGLRDL